MCVSALSSTRKHPAPFPLDLAYRLVRMFSFVGDTVLDPFAGSGTTTLAAMKCERKSISGEIEEKYIDLMGPLLAREAIPLLSSIEVAYESRLPAVTA